MDVIIGVASQNLLSPVVLFFALGFFAALVRSDLAVPEAVAKGLSIYLLFAIGFKGGVGVATHGATASLLFALLAGIVLSAVIPLIAFVLLRAVSHLTLVDAAAVAAHYGSISVVTFVAATSMLTVRGIGFEGYMVAVAAVMEAPAIVTALLLVARAGNGATAGGDLDAALMREVLLSGSIVLLVGAFFIGWITGPEGLADIEAFIVDPFKGVLCLFLLDMGLIAGRGIRQGAGVLSTRVVAFAMVMPLLGASLGLFAALLLGLSVGGAAVLATLSASASYIAVPAAMRVALPEANPAIYLTLSLGVTFPFNLVIGIPLYLLAAGWLMGQGGG